MCLITTQTKPYIAEKDLTVAKHLVQSKYFYNGAWVTPWRKIPVNLNETLRADGEPRIRYVENLGNQVDVGFIHAYVFNIDDTLLDSPNLSLFKAVIPQGTEYFISDTMDEICASEMFITDEAWGVHDGNERERVMSIFNPFFNDVRPYGLQRGLLLGSDSRLYRNHEMPYGVTAMGIIIACRAHIDACQVRFFDGSCKWFNVDRSDGGLSVKR